MTKHKTLIIGLGSIGKNLALSLADKGYKVFVWDIDRNKRFKIKGIKNIKYINNIDKFIKFNKIITILAIPSGIQVDRFIKKNIFLFKKKSYIIDIGNNHPSDTMRRHLIFKKRKVNYIGCGLSGGTHGARNNASIMLGCSNVDFKILKNLFIDIVGKKNKAFLKLVGRSPNAGNYVKIIHNAIEYGIMQAIGDYYLLMKEIIKLDDKQILHELHGLEKLLGSSYLVNITKKIIESPKSKNYLIKNILDQVDDNNTGTWAAILSSECKYPAPSLTTAVEARFISRQNRIFKNIKKTIKRKDYETKRIISDAQIITKISIASCYLQGLGLLKEISKIKKINFNFKSVILSWIKNSIIRSKLLERYLILAKKSNIDIEYLAKKEFSLKNREILINFMKFTVKSNLFLPSSNSIFAWSNMLSNKKYISFSLIQSQRNFFGSHKLKFLKK